MKLERAVIEVFGGCNYSCSMCPQSTGRGKFWTRKMPFDLFIDLLDQLVEVHGSPLINLEGSGEPTLAHDLYKYVRACTDRGLRSFIYCNGSNMSGDYMKGVIDAGLSHVRFSVIGYNQALYKKWMSVDNFERVKLNIAETMQYISQSNASCEVSSYHLILNNDNVKDEIKYYRQNFIDEVGCIGYIWKMHNWSGNYSPEYIRNSANKKTCGRPFAPEITIRSGGINGQHGAVTPCCQTMGPPNEDLSVLGHASNNSLLDILTGNEYSQLKEMHRLKKWPVYCKNCDFLIDDPSVLVWSNDKNAKINHMLGTNFSLTDYKDLK